MKKIISIFTLMTMLSVSITANALVTKTETSANFNVSYVTEAGEALDLSTLKADDIFCINVELENADNVLSAGLEYTWDESILEPVAYDYNSDGKVLTDVWDIYNISNEGDYVANNIQENTAVKSGKYYTAVLNQTDLSKVTANKVKYEVFDPAPGDTKYAEIDGSCVYLKASFKVKKTGDAKLTFNQAQLQEHGMAAVSNISILNDPNGSLTIGSTVVEEKTHAVVKDDYVGTNPAVNNKYSKGFKVEVTPNDDKLNSVSYALKCAGKESLEKASGSWDDLALSGAVTYSFAINVINIPSDVNEADITNTWTVDITAAE